MFAHSINNLYFCVSTLAKLKNWLWNGCSSNSRETHLLQKRHLAFSVGRWGHRYLRSNEIPAPKSSLAIGLEGSQIPPTAAKQTVLISPKSRVNRSIQPLLSCSVHPFEHKKKYTFASGTKWKQEPLVAGLLCILSIIKSFHFAILKQFQLLKSFLHFSAGCWELLISCSTVHLSKVIWLSFLWLITE